MIDQSVKNNPLTEQMQNKLNPSSEKEHRWSSQATPHGYPCLNCGINSGAIGGVDYPCEPKD